MPNEHHFSHRGSNPDFRHRTDLPAPSVEEIEQRLFALLTPGVFAPLRRVEGNVTLRDRLLTLPVMAAIVVSVVWRRIPALTEVLRVLACEGLLWVEAVAVSKQALSKRLATLPATLFARLLEEVLTRLWKLRGDRTPVLPGMEAWGPVVEAFRTIWIADGSTLEALKQKVAELREQVGCVLGGKMLMVVEAFTHVPVTVFYTTEAEANDKTFADRLVDLLPVGGLLIFDLGFFSFALFDQLTNARTFFVTRLRGNTAYRVVRVLSQGPRYRDEIIQLGLYRSNPCQHPVRLISVLWNQTWYRYATNVLDPTRLSAQQVCVLYRRRWRIEDAFLITKRLLGLAYLWVGGTNGVEIQLYATWIFSAVLTDICQQVAQALGQPLDRISVEMVFRGCYHFSQAVQRGDERSLVTFLVDHARLLGIVKAIRKRHTHIHAQQQEIWGTTLS